MSTQVATANGTSSLFNEEDLRYQVRTQSRRFGIDAAALVSFYRDTFDDPRIHEIVEDEIRCLDTIDSVKAQEQAADTDRPRKSIPPDSESHVA